MSKQALVLFSIGLKYKDVVWYDVVAMHTVHLLLVHIGNIIEV